RRGGPGGADARPNAEGGMTLASEDIVPHLLDYRLPFGVTAHQLLLVEVAVFMIGLFWWASRRISTQPRKTGVVALLEVAMVWVRDEVVYPWLGTERGRRYLGFFWTLFFFIIFSYVWGLLAFPVNRWGRSSMWDRVVLCGSGSRSVVMIRL